ncbi:MAG: hypothetical protein ABW278_13205 [Steroidobacteraceae bacterium]
MRTSPSVLGLAFIAGLVSPVFAAESPFLGQWTATAAAPTGNASEIVTVVKTASGYAITAKLVDPAPGQPEAGPGKDIVLEGDRFSYRRTVAIGDSELVITYTGVVSGDTFSGAIEMAAVKIPFTGQRITGAPRPGN